MSVSSYNAALRASFACRRRLDVAYQATLLLAAVATNAIGARGSPPMFSVSTSPSTLLHLESIRSCCRDIDGGAAVPCSRLSPWKEASIHHLIMVNLLSHGKDNV